MEVLLLGYYVPFHRFPLVSSEPVEFLSYALGSVWGVGVLNTNR